jgi:hypothetical protein
MPANKNLSNVNVGTSPNSHDGDTLRDAFVKINNDFSSIYNNGQFLTYSGDTNQLPGYTWVSDTNTGMYSPGSGKISFTLNGVESLSLNENGTFRWLGADIATQSYVSTLLNTFTGGINAANIIVTVNAGANVQTNVTVSGLPVVSSLPTIGNSQGRIVQYNGDVWIFSGYPAGNGVGLSSNPSIARAAGSDYRWVRFRGDSAISVGSIRPETVPEGTIFYETGNAIPYLYISGAWRTLASAINQNSPLGLEVLVTLPPAANPANYTGRTVVVGSNSYIYISGAWNNLGNYIKGTVSSTTGSGISFGSTIPAASGNVGDLFRKTGANADLYIYNGTVWQNIARYTSNNSVMRVPTLPALPADATNYDAGSLIIVGSRSYILNTTKTSWDLYTPGNVNTTTGITLNAGQVGNVQLAANAVIASKIAPNTILGYHLVSNTITSREISVGTIDATKLAANAVTGIKIQNGTITNDKIATNSIDGAKILVGTIGRSQLAANIFNSISVSANNLSEISTNVGIISRGTLRSTDGKMVIDLNSKYIRIEF